MVGTHFQGTNYYNSRKGRPTIPARVLATVMVLQALEGLSDQEAVDHLECDLRWQAAAGVDAGYVAFHSTVLVGQRNRLRASDRPKRFLDDTKVVAREAGRANRRVIGMTPLLVKRWWTGWSVTRSACSQ